MLLEKGMQGAVAFRIRDVIDSDNLNFKEAVTYMTEKFQIAPAYFIIGWGQLLRRCGHR